MPGSPLNRPGRAAIKLDRVVETVRRRGAADTARLLRRRVKDRVHLSESHVWYGLELGAPRPRWQLDEGLVLRRAGEHDLDAVSALPDAGSQLALAAALEEGHHLWLVEEGGTAAFCCWTHWDRAPVAAAPDGWLDLPAGTVCVEDSVTSPAYRGRGVAPAAWCGIADDLADAGQKALITKVEVDNRSSRRAVEKAGFAEVAIMARNRRFTRTRVDVRSVSDGLGSELTRLLSS
jgi:ribosomal protein S18 acetylase RimI-like enzyme